jgi:hypothetical protein
MFSPARGVIVCSRMQLFWRYVPSFYLVEALQIMNAADLIPNAN